MKQISPFYAALVALALFLNLQSHAQDLIIRKDSSKIFCKILQVDSTTIVYTKPPGQEQVRIARSEITNYYVQSAKKITSVRPQTDTRKNAELFYITIYGGLATPMGKFASKDLTDSDAGLAKQGFLIQEKLNLRLTDHFAFNLSFLYQQNPFDIAEIRDQSSMMNPGVRYITSSEPWKVRGLFGGLSFYIPETHVDNLSLYFDLAAGYPMFISPKVSLQAIYNGQTSYLYQRAMGQRAPSFYGNFGFQYKWRKYVAFHLDIGYLVGQPTYNNIPTYTSGGSGISRYTQTIQTLNARGGICFIIYRKPKTGAVKNGAS